MRRTAIAVVLAFACGALAGASADAAQAAVAPPPTIVLPVSGTTYADVFSLLPAIVPDPETGFDPASPNPCISGQTSCVQDVITQLQNVVSPLAAGCSHNVIFPLTYLRVTQEELASHSWTPPLFQDPGYIDYMDGLFASYYLRAYQSWTAGKAVAPAWNIAFSEAKSERVNALGDLLLGMDAHILNDLPFVIYQSGLTAPDGSSRKPDYDAVDAFLYPITGPLFAEIARRFDPNIYLEGIVTGTPLGPNSLFGVLAGWRELAWRDAELLAAAPDPAARLVVSHTIEATAAAMSETIEAGTSYLPLSGGAAQRNAFCQAHVSTGVGRSLQG
jgi:hypothetical protein